MHYDTVIIGGGVSGLSTAFYLDKLAAAKSKTHSYALLDSADYWGGKIKSRKLQIPSGEYFLIEDGPDSFVSQKPQAIELIKELKLEDRIIDARGHNSQVWIYLKGRLVALPEGVMLMVPTKFLPFIASSLISIKGKLRVAAEFLVKKRIVKEDESLAAFVRRRMGKEVLEKIAEPLLAGIFSADPEKQSISATFPHFVEMERKYGSLVVGFLRARFKKKLSSSKHSMFVSLKDGMQSLSDTLAGTLKGKCSLTNAVTEISQLAEGGYSLKLSNGFQIAANSVVITLPAYAAGRLIANFAADAASQLENIRYVSTGSLYLAYKKSEIVSLPKGFGVLVPKSEQRTINSISFSSQKFSDRSPADYVLIRVSFGGSRNPDIMSFDDESILNNVKLDLADILGISSAPVLSHIHRWKQAMPQYDVGHQSRIEKLENSLPAGLFLAGSAFHGVSIPDCIMQGRKTASELLK